VTRRVSVGAVKGVGGGRRRKEDASVMVVLSRGVKWVSLSLLESEIRGGISLLDRFSNGQGGIDGAGADRLPSMALRIMLLLPVGGGGG